MVRDARGLERASEADHIPRGWESVRLGDVARIRYGLGQPPELDDQGVPLLRATNIKRGRLVKDGLLRVRREAIPASRNAFLHAGEIVVVRSGAYTGDVALVTPEWDGAVAGYDLIVSPKERIDPTFCAFMLLGSPVQAYFRSQRDRSAQPHLNSQQLAQTELLLPALGEQRSIAGVLRAIQQAKETTGKVIVATRELKRSLMRHLFTYGPVPVDLAETVGLQETEIGQVPKHWRVVRVDEIAHTTSGGTPSRSKPHYYGGPIPWVKSGELGDGLVSRTAESITEQALRESSAKLFPAGTLLIAMYGATAGKVGVLAMAATTNQAVCAIFPSDGALSDYLFYAMMFGRGRLLVERHGGAQPNISQRLLRSFHVPLPPKSEQENIVRTLQTVDRKLRAEEARQDALTFIFDALMPDLMNGNRRVAAEEVASA